MKFSGKVGNGQTNKWLNFCGYADHESGSGYGSGSYRDTGNLTCLDGGMHCPSASTICLT